MSLRLTIIIPTYNRAPLVTRLIDQLMAQTDPPEEIIVVDDHSTDDTRYLIEKQQKNYTSLQYLINNGHHQRDAKACGLRKASGDYIGFLDDDAIIEDKDFFAKLRPRLKPTHVIQAKIILEQMGYRDEKHLNWRDYLAQRPYPILELITASYHRGTHSRQIFPIIEWGNFWPRKLAPFFIDPIVINDGYGESYSAALQLHRQGIRLLFDPQLVIRHPGATIGGSHKFKKMTMLKDFTVFHEGYFYNMIYLHTRFWRHWIWLWLPFYIGKSLIALAVNHNLSGWYHYAWQPIKRALREQYGKKS